MNLSALQVACIEALDAEVPSAAKQALLVLLESMAAGSSGGSQQQAPGYEATIFQNLIKLTQVCCLERRWKPPVLWGTALHRDLCSASRATSRA